MPLAATGVVEVPLGGRAAVMVLPRGAVTAMLTPVTGAVPELVSRIREG